MILVWFTKRKKHDCGIMDIKKRALNQMPKIQGKTVVQKGTVLYKYILN